MRFVGLYVPTSAAVEDLVAGEQHEGNVRGEVGEPRRHLDIQCARELRIALAGFRPAQGRAVNDEAGFEDPPQLADPSRVGEIEVGTAQSLDPLFRRPARGVLDEVAPDKAAGARDKHRGRNALVHCVESWSGGYTQTPITATSCGPEP